MTMKTYQILFAAMIPAIAGLSSCSDDREVLTGEGRVMISATVNSDVKVVSRATAEEELGEQCLIWISGTKGLVRQYQGINNVPASGINLVAGHYVAEAWTGDSVSASFEDRWFKGYQPFDVNPGATTQVNIVCRIANVVASVSYDNAVDEVLSDYTMTIGHNRGSLTFEGRDSRKGYFMMPSSDKDLSWTLTGKKADGSVYTRSGVISAAKPATEYVLKVRYTGSDAEIGGGHLTIEIDEHTVDVPDEIVIAIAPEIKGYGFDIDQPYYAEQGKVGRRSLYLTASTSLKSVVLQNDRFTELLGISGDDFNFLGMEDAVKTAVEAKGINAVYTYDSELDVSNMKINFEETFTNSLAEGTYPIVVTATDASGKSTTRTFDLVISNADVAANGIVEADVWATSATVTGSILKDGVDASVAGFNYRKQGEQSWKSIAASANGRELSAKIAGLEPGTIYEYTAYAGDFVSTEIKTFMTEEAIQLPNSGFEDWNTASTPYLIYAEGGSAFWDSGNHGSATMSKNVTTPDTDIKHSGEYSIKLTSQYVGIKPPLGKFAAGNVFIGKYLETDGTDGVLGFGRPFASRPTALKGYIRYVPQKIAYEGKYEVTTDEMDQGIIYIAILDATTDSYKGEAFPVIINTKTEQLFDKNAANVIAYGEYVVSGTDGDGMVEFTIPLDYRRTDIKAANIMITCSASKGGDYFRGGNSVMYLDDFTLVYE